MSKQDNHPRYQSQQTEADNTLPGSIWGNSFMGVPMVQAWQDLMLWERFLHQHNPKFILELGTFNGGLSTFLGIQAWSIQAGFMTVDWQDWVDHDHPLWRALGLDKCYLNIDIRTPRFIGILKDLLSAEHNHPFLLFCDNGNKPLEFQTFGPLLRTGDFLAVHDVTHEFNITSQDMGEMEHRVKQLLVEPCQALNSLTAWFEVL